MLVRAMPIVLPHKLLPWLVRQGVWPDVAMDAVDEYWNHQERFSTGIQPPSHQHHPVWLWGDDCRYGKKINQKVMVVMMGHVLDPCRSSYHSCFPLWVCGVDSCQL